MYEIIRLINIQQGNCTSQPNSYHQKVCVYQTFSTSPPPSHLSIPPSLLFCIFFFFLSSLSTFFPFMGVLPFSFPSLPFLLLHSLLLLPLVFLLHFLMIPSPICFLPVRVPFIILSLHLYFPLYFFTLLFLCYHTNT